MSLHRIAPPLMRFLLSCAALLGPWSVASSAEGRQFAEGEVVGRITAPEIDEVSGLAASRSNPDVLWVHNDSGDRARVYAVNTRGEYLGAFELSGARVYDCEDIAVGPGPVPGLNYIYLGDTGDNYSARGGKVVVYRLPEPVVYPDRGDQSRTVETFDKLLLRYPDGPHDVEALLCDPVSGDLYLITKRETYNLIFRAPANCPAEEHVELETMGSMAWTGTGLLGLPLYGAVAADVSPDGREILRKRYHTASLYRRDPRKELSRALVPPARPFIIPCNAEQQGEAIGFDAWGQGYYTLGEGSDPPLLYYRRLSDDGPPAPRALVPAGSQWSRVNVAGEPQSDWQPDRPQHETAVARSASAARERWTCCYRRAFTVVDPAGIAKLSLKVACNGGVVVSLNGSEIARSRLAADAGHDTPAAACPPHLSDTWLELPLNQPRVQQALCPGLNVLAVEVHDTPDEPAHATFDLQLWAVSRQADAAPAALGVIGALTLVALGFVWWRRRRRSRIGRE